MMRSSIAALCLVFACVFAHAQDDRELEKQNIIEQRIEILSNNLEEGAQLDYTNLVEDLTYYFDHPLNLNTASDEELRDLYLLTDLQIAALRRHMALYGKFKSLYELQAVNGFDLQTIRLIQPFVTVRQAGALDNVALSQIVSDGNNELFVRYRRTLQQLEGFKPDAETGKPDFLGTPNYYYARYRFQFRKNIIAGFTIENDVGEPWRRGPDFGSAHLFYRSNSLVRTIAIGDYQAQFGQGLTFWNGLGFGKSPFVLNVKKNAYGLRPYRSVNEALFLRGVAVELQRDRWRLTSFGSMKKLDATLELSTDSAALDADDNLVASTILLSGLHRTESELRKKSALTETIGGANLRYERSSFSAGLTAVHTRYSAPLDASSSLYRINSFSGTSATNVGFDYQGVIRNLNVFGEIARSSTGAIAMTHGLLAALHPKLSLSAVYRNFPQNYYTPYFNVFAENFRPQNEQGLFIGLEAKLGNAFTLTAYTDQIKYKWLRFRVQAPTTADDHLIQLNYKPDKKNEIYFRYQVRNGFQDGNVADARIDYPVERRIQIFRFNAIYQAHPNVQMRTRAQWQTFHLHGSAMERGFLMYQDVIWEKMGQPISLTFRYAIFQTDSWNTRIYAYESDVLYGFSIPPYSGRGARTYGMVRWNIRKGLDLWVRVAQWMYTDRTEISSGLNQIDGNKRTDLTVQMRFMF